MMINFQDWATRGGGSFSYATPVTRTSGSREVKRVVKAKRTLVRTLTFWGGGGGDVEIEVGKEGVVLSVVRLNPHSMQKLSFSSTIAPQRGQAGIVLHLECFSSDRCMVLNYVFKRSDSAPSIILRGYEAVFSKCERASNWNWVGAKARSSHFYAYLSRSLFAGNGVVSRMSGYAYQSWPFLTISYRGMSPYASFQIRSLSDG